MADQFGVQATDIQASTDAGTQVVQPVQEALPASPVPGAIAQIGSIFKDGLDGIVKQAAVDQKTAVLKSVSEPIGALNVAFSTGQINNDEYTTRSQSIYNAAVASHPELASEFAGIASVNKATTAAGTVQDNEKAAADLRNKALDNAQSNGYLITKDMTPQQQDVVIQANQSHVALNQYLQRQTTMQALATSQQNFANTQTDRQKKQDATTVLTQVAGNDQASLAAEWSAISAQADAAKGDPKTLQALQAQWTNRIASSKNVLTAAGAAGNPELASAYGGVYDQWTKLGDQLDPVKRSANIDAQVKGIVGNAQLIGVQDPKTAALAAASDLFKNSPYLLLNQTANAASAVTRMATTPYNGPQSTIGNPPIVGSTDEKSIWAGMKSTLTSLGQDASATPQSQEEAGNMINHSLHNVGDMVQKGATPQQLKSAADFFASPEYAAYVKTGKVSPDAAQAAQATMQTIYNPAVTQAVGNTLSGQVADGTKVRDLVTVNYTGGGLQFTPRTGLSAADQQQAQATIKSLQPAVTGLNTITRIGTHLEGGTDYASNWEKNKYDYLPQMFPVRPGQVVNGNKYTGGDYRDPKSWQAVGGQ